MPASARKWQRWAAVSVGRSELVAIKLAAAVKWPELPELQRAAASTAVAIFTAVRTCQFTLAVAASELSGLDHASQSELQPIQKDYTVSTAAITVPECPVKQQR